MIQIIFASPDFISPSMASQDLLSVTMLDPSVFVSAADDTKQLDLEPDQEFTVKIPS